MRGTRWSLLGAGLLALLLPPALLRAQAVRAVDDAGRTLALAAPARRIVSLAPNLTELVFAAGAGDRVVGVTRFCNFPPEAAQRQVVGDAFAIDYEALVRLHPDLILVWGSGTPERGKQRLRALGLPVFEVEIRDVAGMALTLRALGRFAGTSAIADAHAAALQRDWQALLAAYGHRSPVRVFYQLWDAPLMTLGPRHGISQAIRACGGRNVFDDLSALTATVSWEVAVQRDPELVVSAASPGETLSFSRWNAFPQVSATRKQQFGQVDGDLISRMGPRFVDGARQLCERIEQARRQQR